MALWFIGYISMDGDIIFFSILAGLLFTGLLLGNLYLSYYYYIENYTGLRTALLLGAWTINYAVLDPLLALLFVVSNICLFYYNIKYLVSSAKTSRLEYPFTFYFENHRAVPTIFIITSTLTYWLVIYFLVL